jgi:hypothetical protein
MINRTVAVIKPKAPFLAWIHSIPDLKMTSVTLDDLRSDDSTAFLLPECDSLDESRVYVNKIHKTIFEIELEGWWRDPADWPQKITAKKFHEWFDVEYHSLVIDTTGDDFLIMEY